ncbi:MAG: hypothetical protein KAV87_37310 [Desulfobacteraceae bacterium]|nr:hypothetical protein [Desulfobacteraceae bacterium]
MGGSRAGTSTTTVKRLPEYAQPYAKSYIERGEGLSNDAYVTYSGATIAPQSQDEIDGITAMASRGRDGDPVMNEGVILMELILNGAFLLGTRQAFIDMWDEVQAPLASEINTLKSLIGGQTLYYTGAPIVEDRTSGELAQYATTILNRMERRLYRENYDIERELQSVAIGSSIQIGGHEIVNAELLRMSGVHQREYNQAVLHDLYRIWMEGIEGEIKRLDILGNSIRALVGTQSAITKPYYRPSKTASTAGGAISGATIGYQMGGAWGAVAGGIVGGVFGNMSS